MIFLKKVKIFLPNSLKGDELYLVIKTSENTLVSGVERIRNGMFEWNLQGVLSREECLERVGVQVWDYNRMGMIGRHSISRFQLDTKNQCSYNGFIGSHQQIKLSVLYQILEKESKEGKTERKAKQTKRTDSTNRESKNSRTHEQPSSIKQLYKSLIHSISQRNAGSYLSPSPSMLQNKPSPKLSPPSTTLKKYNNFI